MNKRRELLVDALKALSGGLILGAFFKAETTLGSLAFAGAALAIFALAFFLTPNSE